MLSESTREDDVVRHRQERGLTAWREAVAAEQSAVDIGDSREVRMDQARRREVLARQHEAVEARLLESAAVGAVTGPRAVIAHRNDWFVNKITAELQALGVEVLACVEDGADAIGVCVVEQPDLLLVEDVLLRMTGVEVIREVRVFCPSTVCVAQVGYSNAVESLLEAGALGGFPRGVTPADVARGAVEIVTAGR